MKKTLRILSLVMVLAMALSVFTGCAAIDKIKELLGLGGPVAETVTVTWYQGSKELRTEEVEKGTILESWTPEVEGKTFTGWYAEASLTQAFDFTQPVTEDTDLFAAFKSDEYVEDTNNYYLIGTGAGDMGQAAWDHAKAEANLSMTKKDVAGANVYTITLDMYAGDRFQICFGGSWDGQVGIGYMEGAEYCDGVNEYDKVEYTAADKKVAQVKDAEGNVVFVGSDEYNKGFEVWNIILAEGMDGKYEFTYTTYPASPAYNQITWKLVEKIEPLTQTHDMHFIGTHNGWSESFKEGEWALNPSEDKSFWSGFITITEEHYADWTEGDANNPLGVKCAAIKIFNTIDGGYHSVDGNNMFLTAGTYAVKYTVEGNKVEIAPCDYFIVGTLIDADGKAVNYAVKDGVSPKLELQEDGSLAVVFEAYDATGLADYSWMTSQGKVDANGVAAIISIKVVYGSELGIKDWYSAEGGDNWYLSAGKYSVTLKDGAVTVAPATEDVPADKVTHVLKAEDIEAFAQGDKADGDTLAGDFFTIHWSAKTKVDGSKKTFADDFYTEQRINWGGTTTVGEVTKNCVEFTSTGTTTIKVWWVCAGNGREIGVFGEDGSLVAATTESAEKDGLYVSTITLDAGHYFIGTDCTNAEKSGGNYLFKIEVVVE